MSAFDKDVVAVLDGGVVVETIADVNTEPSTQHQNLLYFIQMDALGYTLTPF